MLLELATPTIAEGIASCIQKGATAIAVMPILLLAAQHAKQDIPKEMAKAQKQYPYVKFTYGEPLGIHERLIDTLQARIIENSNLTAMQVFYSSDVGVVIQPSRGFSENCQKATY